MTHRVDSFGIGVSYVEEQPPSRRRPNPLTSSFHETVSVHAEPANRRANSTLTRSCEAYWNSMESERYAMAVKYIHDFGKAALTKIVKTELDTKKAKESKPTASPRSLSPRSLQDA